MPSLPLPLVLGGPISFHFLIHLLACTRNDRIATENLSILTEQPPLLPKLIALNKRPDDLESVSARFLLTHPILCLAAAGWNQGAIKLFV